MFRRSAPSDPLAQTAALRNELEEVDRTSHFPSGPVYRRRRPASATRAVLTGEASRSRRARNVESSQHADESSEEEQQPKIKPIDYQGLQYVDNVDQSLVCPICLTPMHDPATTIACGHTFCRRCLCLAVKEKPLCPLCRVEVPQGLGPITSLILKEQLDRLRVKCPNAECDEILTKGEVNAHYENRCEWTRVRCRGENATLGIMCALSVPRRYHEEDCKHRRVSCSYCHEQVVEADMERHYRLRCAKAMGKCEQCGLEVVRGRTTHHKLSECPERIVECRWRSHGCRTSERKNSLSGHEDTCVYAAIAKLSTDVAQLKEARGKDKELIELLLEGRVYDQAIIKHLRDTLALSPGLGVENGDKTCSTSEGCQRQITEDTIGALDTMATRMAAMDSTLGTVVPTLETVVHKHELYAMHSDMVNRLRQVMRLHRLVRDRRVIGANKSSKEAQPSTAGDATAARPRLQQPQQQEDEDGNVPVSRRAENTTLTEIPPPYSRRSQSETTRPLGSEVHRRRRSTDGQGSGAPKL